MNIYTANNDLRDILQERLQWQSYVDVPLDIYSIKDGYIVPTGIPSEDWKYRGGVLTADYEFVMNSAYHLSTGLEGSFCKEYKVVEKEYLEKVIFLGQLYDCWGHVITDNLSKLWYVFTDNCRSLLKEGYKLVYTMIDNKPMPIYVQQVMNLLEINTDDCIQITVPCKCGDIVIPDYSLQIIDSGVRCYTKQFFNLITHINGKIDEMRQRIPLYEKIYLTRSHFANESRERGENKLEVFFEHLGYKVIAPEEYSVVEQIAMVRNAKSIAVTEGSVAHTTIFCKPHTKVQLLMKADYCNGYQIFINKLAQLDVTYISAHHSVMCHPTHPWWGPFYMYVSPELKKWANTKQPTISYKLLPSYFFYTHPDVQKKCQRFCRLPIRIKKKVKLILKIIK